MEKRGHRNPSLAWLPGKQTLITIEWDAGWATQSAGRGKEEKDLIGSGSELVLQQDPSRLKILSKLLVLMPLLHINFQPLITEHIWYACDVITYNLRGEDRLTIDDRALNTASFLILSHTLPNTPHTVNSVEQCCYRELTHIRILWRERYRRFIRNCCLYLRGGGVNRRQCSIFCVFYIILCININF